MVTVRTYFMIRLRPVSSLPSPFESLLLRFLVFCYDALLSCHCILSRIITDVDR
jgi:hypothetical protein